MSVDQIQLELREKISEEHRFIQAEMLNLDLKLNVKLDE